MTVVAVMTVGKHSAEPEPDDIGWFRGDLADDLPTLPMRQFPESLLTRWAPPTPEFLARLLEALKNNL